MGSKRAHFTCLCIQNGLGSFLKTHIFDPFLVPNSPFSRDFVTLEGPQWLAMGSKWAHFTCLCTPNGLGSFLEKPIFDPFLMHFFVAKQPIHRAFWDFRRAKTGHHELKTRQEHLFWHSKWSTMTFEKIHFFCTRWTLGTHLGIDYGNFEGRKPPRVGGCGWIRCTRNRVLIHVAQDMVCSWFGDVGGQCAQILGLSGGLLGGVRGHIMELEGPRGTFDTRKSVWVLALN